MTEPKPTPNKPKHKRLFYLILILLPLVILSLIEFGLRLANYGQTYPLFVPVSSERYQGYIRPNPEILKRYFSSPVLAPDIQPESFYFKADKGKDTFRIVVQGGSTAAGFPYGISGSLAGMLNQRFKRLYPDKDIEIISTAMAAINSYMLLDFAEEIIDIEPDLVLIYAGHNEYLGIMGVGSALASKGSHAANLLYLKLKDIRLVQLIGELIFSLQSVPQKSDSESASGPQSRSMMAIAAREKNIPIGSELFELGIQQFSGNLDLLLDQYRNHQIPVFLSTLVSNENGLEPFSSAEGVDGADSYYTKAKQLEAEALYQQALESYQIARDRDLLRFRAPSVFNDIIRDKVDEQTVYLVDAEKHLRNESPNQIIGGSLLLEHVHPNQTGYFLLADAFVEKLLSENILGEVTKRYARPALLLDIPITKVTSLLAEYTIRLLKAEFPFTTQKQAIELGPFDTFESQKALDLLNKKSWLDTHFSMVNHYYANKDDAEAAKVAALISDYFFNNADIALLAGDIYMFLNDHAMALYYHKRALSVEPNNTKILASAVGSYLTNGYPQESLKLLNRILELEPDNAVAQGQKDRLLQIMN